MTDIVFYDWYLHVYYAPIKIARIVLQFTATDIFNSGNNYRLIDQLAVADAIINRNFNFRLAAYKLTYTHNFGNSNSVKTRREIPTGAQEELNRVRN